MIVETKYKLGQTLFFLNEDIVTKGTVYGLSHSRLDNTETYWMAINGDTTNLWTKPNNKDLLFETKEDLLINLTSKIR